MEEGEKEGEGEGEGWELLFCVADGCFGLLEEGVGRLLSFSLLLGGRLFNKGEDPDLINEKLLDFSREGRLVFEMLPRRGVFGVFVVFVGDLSGEGEEREPSSDREGAEVEREGDGEDVEEGGCRRGEEEAVEREGDAVEREGAARGREESAEEGWRLLGVTNSVKERDLKGGLVEIGAEGEEEGGESPLSFTRRV